MIYYGTAMIFLLGMITAYHQRINNLYDSILTMAFDKNLV